MNTAQRINRVLALVIVIVSMAGMAWPVSKADAQSVEISPEQVNEYCKRLRFDEDQLAVAQELFDAHVADRHELLALTRALREEHRAKFPERSKRSALKEFAIEVQDQEAKEKMNNALLDDLHLLQSPSETAAMDWESTVRSHQIYAAQLNCGLARSRFDLPAVVAHFEAEDPQRLALEMEAYEREMLLQARRQKTLDDQTTVAFPRAYDDNGQMRQGVHDTDFAKLFLRQADTTVAIGKVQWKFALRFERCLVESDRVLYRREVYVESCLNLPITEIEKHLKRAASDESLLPQTRDAVLALSREFEKRSAKPLAAVAEGFWQRGSVGIRRAFEPDQEKWAQQNAIVNAELSESRTTWEALQSEFATKLEAILARQQASDDPST